MEKPLIGRPRHYYVCSGSGTGDSQLVAFDLALRAAGIADYNLLKVSSILPPGAVSKDGVDLPLGSLLPCVYAVATSRDDTEVSSAVAVAIPDNPGHVGVIMEWSGPAPEAEARARVMEMAKEAMAVRGNEVKEIIVASSRAKAGGNGVACAVAAVALW